MKPIALFAALLTLLLSNLSCKQSGEGHSVLKSMEFVLVDSLVFDHLGPYNLLDYHKDKGLYLFSAKLLEGTYYLVNDAGEVVAENSLADGPNGFGMVLHRAGFVGDEVVLVGTNRVFVYDLQLVRQRDYPFEQEVRFRLAHAVRDYLSTFLLDGKEWPLVNISEQILPRYPVDYFDTLNLVHLMDVQTGEVREGGKLDAQSAFMQGQLSPWNDKPVYFSDRESDLISVILFGDSVLYQIDPRKGFATVNRISVPRIPPDVWHGIPMEDATMENVRAGRLKSLLSGTFFNMMGKGNAFLLAYRTGGDGKLLSEEMDNESRQKFQETRKVFYIPIRDGRVEGDPVLWNNPGDLVLGVGENRYLQYATDQAVLHDYEKDYQCYYIFELREK
ncbi:MAG: hypothetical protein JJU34_16765 [Lunatimonas sp.]|uniref:hypothetical protein n=1 Tax=Lunatimonas sp. TaxID=2060141 RepID=UPI00263AF189|nr:hypothetical protein [Lunatimonas sp.]MCC5938932.1 hypothetical protein [Lunatimonas sp.]